jgi:hypothetical protein
MTKEYLITLAINFALFHNQIYSTDVKGLMEWMDTLTFDELLAEYLDNVEYISH